MRKRFSYRPLFICLLLCGCYPAFSQHYNFKHFTIQDGLPSASVYEAFQDKQGFMWFATSAGVSRFDGYKFTNYTTKDGLGDNEILGFYQDSFGRIWFRSLNGKVSYYYNGKFFNSDNTASLKNLDMSSMIRQITESADSSILITHFRHGFAKYTSKDTTLPLDLVPHEVMSSFPVGYFGVYENHPGNYTLPLSGKMITTDVEGNYKVGALPYFNYLSTIKKFDSTFYVTYENKLIKVIESDTTPPHVWIKTNADITNISLTSEAIWLGTRKGAIAFNLRDTTQTSRYLEEEQIASITEDAEKNTWFTTLENGVFLLTNQYIKNYTVTDGLSSNKVFSVDRDDAGNVWLGHDNYVLTCINPLGNASQKTIISKIPEIHKTVTPHIYEVVRSGDEFIIAAGPASFYLDNNDITILYGLYGKCIWPWYSDVYAVASGGSGLNTFSKKKVLAHRRNEFSGFNDIGTITKNFDIKRILLSRTNCLFQQKEGKLWVGTDDGLIYMTRDTIFNYYDQYPLLRERILDIKENSAGTVYMASDKGVLILKDNKVTRVTTQQGLSSDNCHTIQLEGKTLWVATNAGVNRVSLRDDVSVESIFIINTTQGLPSNYIYDVLVDSSNVWVGTPNGLSVIDKNINIMNPMPPVTYITELNINSRRIDTTNYEFSHKENNLKIEFIGLSYRSLGDIHYRYRLSDANSPSEFWQETTNTSVDLTLSPGSYTFEVKAQNSSGVWGEPAVYSFVINPPFWNTWWFITLSAIGLGSVMALSLKYIYTARQKKAAARLKMQMTELKSLRSQMNYHFMSNAFNSLQGLFLSENGVDKYLGKFSKLMRFTLENSNRHIIPLTEELEYLKLYCDIEQLRVGDRFQFVIEYDKTIEPTALVVPALSLQPFVENAIWHGIMPKEGLGSILLKVLPNDQDTYKIIIEDNGVGINHSLSNKTKTTRKSFGTKLVMDRFEVIRQQSKKFELTIEDRADIDQSNGTRITLILPYHYDE